VAKVSFVPKHYSLNVTPTEFESLLRGYRSYVENYHVDEEEEVLYAAMLEAYQGELGRPPGDPIDEDEGGALVGN
jgi:hypothetical protein